MRRESLTIRINKWGNRYRADLMNGHAICRTGHGKTKEDALRDLESECRHSAFSSDFEAAQWMIKKT